MGAAARLQARWSCWRLQALLVVLAASAHGGPGAGHAPPPGRHCAQWVRPLRGGCDDARGGPGLQALAAEVQAEAARITRDTGRARDRSDAWMKAWIQSCADVLAEERCAAAARAGAAADAPQVRAETLAAMQAGYKRFKARLKADKRDSKVALLRLHYVPPPARPPRARGLRVFGSGRPHRTSALAETLGLTRACGRMQGSVRTESTTCGCTRRCVPAPAGTDSTTPVATTQVHAAKDMPRACVPCRARASACQCAPAHTRASCTHKQGCCSRPCWLRSLILR